MSVPSLSTRSPAKQASVLLMQEFVFCGHRYIQSYSLNRTSIYMPSGPRSCPCLGFPSFAEVRAVDAPLASRANSFSGILNRETPQSMQIRILGDSKTPALSRFCRPGKCTFISAVNSA